jgi:hypothetical protein
MTAGGALTRRTSKAAAGHSDSRFSPARQAHLAGGGMGVAAITGARLYGP